MKKRLTALLMALIMILDMASITVEAISGPYFSVSSQTVYPGNSTTVSVSGTDLSALGAVDLEIYYDSTAMTVNSTSTGSLMGDAIADINTDTDGVIKLSAISLSGISGSGKLLNINFTANNSCPRGKYPVQVTVGDAHDTSLNHVDIAGGTGYITVEEKQVSQKTFYLNNYMSPYNVSKRDTVTCRVNNSNSYPFAAASFDIGYDPEILQVESVTVNSNLQVDGCVYDVNTDLLGKVKVGIASNVELNSYELINVVFRVIADVDTTSTVSAAVSEVYADDLSEYIGYTTSSGFRINKLPEVADYPDLTLSVQDMIVGKEYTSTLSLEKGAPVGAADFAVAFDTDVFEIISATPSAEASSKGAMLMINEKFDEGLVRFSYINTKGYEDGLDLIDITYKIKSAPRAHYTAVLSGKGVKTTDYQDIQLDYIPATSCIYGKTAVPPACTQQGYTVYSCSCGKSYNDDYVAETGHTTVADEAVKETCSSTGLTAGSHCSVCGEVFVAQQVIPKLPHTESEIVVENNILPECVKDGSYDNVIYCTVCGEEISRETVVVDVLGHTAVIDNAIPPTCTQTGLTQGRHCKVCGDILTPQYVVDALGHKAGTTVVENNVPPTCENEGSYDNVVYCTVCEDELSRETVTVSAFGHFVENGTLNGDGTKTGVCTRCGSVVTLKDIIYSGTAGDNISWYIDTYNTIYFEGTGSMNGVTWDEYDSIIEKAVIGEGITSLASNAFEDCEKLAEVTLPQTLEGIAGHSFYMCRQLTHIDLPRNIRFISDRAFPFTGLKNLIIPEKVESIGTQAFLGCYSLESIVIPDSVIELNYSSFSSTNLKTVDLPDLLTTIPENAFGSCSYLEEIYFPSSVKTVVKQAFSGCSRLKYVYFSGTEDEWNKISIAENNEYLTNAQIFFNTCEDEHSWVEVSCTQPKHCENCSVVIGESLGHDYIPTITKPTCETAGYTTNDCSRCDSSFVSDHTEALGHRYNAGIITTAPTCTKEGVKTFTCQNDASHTYTEKVDALGHKAGETIVENNVAPDCENDGSYDNVVYCTVCDDELSRVTVVVGALGHKAGGTVVENNILPDCENKGSYDNVVYCTVCGDELSRVNVVVDALGHTAEEPVEENRVEADCITDGHYDVVVYCSVCDKELSRDTITLEKLGHIFTNYVSNKDATCTSNGTETAKCNRCNVTDTREDKDSALGHNYIPTITKPTCQTAGYTTNDCSRCDSSFVSDHTEALGHKYNAGVITTAPTCTKEGIKTFTCQNDASHTYTEKVEALGHKAGETVVENNIAPDCEDKGSYDNVVYCTVCDDELSRVTVVVEKLGHRYNAGVITTAPTCTKEGVKTFTCQNDASHTYTEKVGALGHKAGETVVENNVAPDCENKGSYDNVVYCTVCDDELSRVTVVVEKLGHRYNAGVITTAPTCTKEGIKTFTCQNDTSHKYTEKVDALGHKAGETVVENNVAPDCEDKGSYDNVIYCTVCDDELSRVTVVVDALGHKAGETVVENNVAPDCENKGSYDNVVYCTVCDDELSRVTVIVDALGHTAEEPVEENRAEADCITDGHYDIVIYCSVCDKELSRTTETLEKLGHSFTDYVLNGDGTKTAVCDRCDATETVNDEIFGGEINETFHWFIDSMNTLHINGSGEIPEDTTPWREHSLIIEKVVVASGITNIPAFAFKDCINLKNAEIPEDIKNIGQSAFENCGALEEIRLPVSTESIGSNAFAGCENLDKIIYDGTSQQWDKIETDENFGGLADKDIAMISDFSYTENSDGTITVTGSNIDLEGDIVIPDRQDGKTVTAIGENAFKGNDKITGIKIPDTVKEIGPGAFSHCENVQRIELESAVEFIGENAFAGISSDVEIYILNNAYAEETLKAKGFENVVAIDYSVAAITLDRDYLIAHTAESYTLTAQTTYPAQIVWSVEGDSVEIIPDGDSCTFTATAPGTAYVVASATFGQHTVYARCRVDVTEDIPAATISAVHLPETSAVSKIYSTNYTQLDIHFDIQQNVMVMTALEDEDRTGNTGLSIEEAYFTNENAKAVFDLRVKDDRTLEIIPKIDLNDAAAIKSVSSSYKTQITVIVNGTEYTTKETLSLKTDKKLPSVKVGSVKLNSFYTQHSQPLVFTMKNETPVSASVDESKATVKTPAIPAWLTLNDDMTVSLKPEFTGSASGKLYMDVMLEGWAVPVKVTASVSASTTAPKLKLSRTKAVFNAYRDKAVETVITLLSSDKKVAFDTINVTDVRVAHPSELTDKELKTYKVCENYVVTDYNAHTGAIAIDVAEGHTAESGKIMLVAEIAGSHQLVKLPVTVTAHTKVPSFKLEKSSATLYTHYAQTSDSISLKVVPTPADYLINTDNFSWTIQNSKGVQLPAETLDVSFADNTVTVRTNDNTPVDKYKVVFELKEAAKTVTVSVTVKEPTLKLSSTSVTLNKLLADSTEITLKPTPADYLFTEENISWTVTDSKNNILPAQTLDITRDGSVVKVAVNENTAPGTSYKVKFRLTETGKETVLTVKTLALTSTAKVSLSVKGKLETGYPAKGLTVTAKWTNLTGGADISENLRVYAKSSTKNSVAVDVTDKFDIVSNGDNTYTVKYKNLDAVNQLNHKDKYTIVAEGMIVNGQSVADSKAATVSVTFTKPKVVQDIKSVKLYLNDRYSRGTVKLTLNDSTLPAIAKVEIAESKISGYYSLKHLGNNVYAIGFKGNRINPLIKAGSLKLNIYLEGNNPANNTPNTTVSVTVSTVKYK